MGWLNINAMPTLFAEAIQNKDKDALVGPIRSGAGFHILKVLDTRGIEKVTVEEVNSRHILVKPSIILSEDKAKAMLNRFKEEVKNGEADFADLAKEHSEDPGSALRGGELGWSDPNNYVPEFKDALAQLEPGEFSEPVRTVHGWHLIQLIEVVLMTLPISAKKIKLTSLSSTVNFQRKPRTGYVRCLMPLT